MTSTACGWSNGRKVWSIEHRSSEDPNHLAVQGRPPAILTTVYEAAKAEQSDDPDTDYLFDVPVEVAASLTGFYFDRDPPGGSAHPFAVLEFGLADDGLASGFPDLTLTLEDRPPVASPTPGQIAHAVGLMNPHGGPSFIILDGRGNDYAQAAGGNGVYTVEWREHQGSAFHHWVAGRPGFSPPWKVAVPTNGARVKVRTNERLKAEDVVSLLIAFSERKSRPEQYAWRDITSVFE